MKVNLGKYPKGDGLRRIYVEIDNYDTWGLDNTLALIILPALLQLKNTKHGVPNEFVERAGGDMDRNYCFDFIKEDENAVFDRGVAKWEETLDKMIWSFQQLAIEDDYDHKYHHGQMKIGWKPIQLPNPVTGVVEEMYEMVDENPDEHWYDYVGHRLHEERIQEGIDLFAKHFRDLWD